MPPWHPKYSKTAKLITLFPTSTHTSHGIDYCQRKDNRFYKPLVGAGAASGETGKRRLRRCFIGGLIRAFRHGREMLWLDTPPSSCRNLVRALWTTWIPHLCHESRENAWNVGQWMHCWMCSSHRLMLEAQWVRMGRNYFYSYLFIHCSLPHCSTLLAQCLQRIPVLVLTYWKQ